MLAIALILAAAANPPPLAPLTTNTTDAGFNALSRGTMGVEFALPGGGAPTVGLTYFLNDGVAARIDFGLNAQLSPSGAPATFDLGVGLRFYQARRGPVALFLAPTLGFGRSVLGNLGGVEYIQFSGALGVEYFFTQQLSAGGQLGLGLRFDDIGGPTGSSIITTLNTGTSGLFANIYF